MTSPVFPIPLIPPQPARALSGPAPSGPAPSSSAPSSSAQPGGAGLAVPLPRGCRSDYDDAGTPLAVTVEDRGGVCVVHADGEVDIATAPLLGRALETGLASGRPTVVVDLRQISFVDCTGIGLLTAARSRAHGQGTWLRILAGRAVARTAALLELTTALGLHEAG